MNKFAKNQVFPCSKHVYIIILLSEVTGHMRFADASLFYHSLLRISKVADQKIKIARMHFVSIIMLLLKFYMLSILYVVISLQQLTYDPSPVSSPIAFTIQFEMLACVASPESTASNNLCRSASFLTYTGRGSLCCNQEHDEAGSAF